MYKFFDVYYNRHNLTELFIERQQSAADHKTKVTENIIEEPSIVDVFEHFNMIPYNKFNFELVEISSYVPPYISPRNNGLIIFPLLGELQINFYSYQGTRESLSPYRKIIKEEVDEIESTLIETVEINKPMAFNGMVAHSYGSTKAVVIAVLKIPLGIQWHEFCSLVRLDSSTPR